jgi:hypothetical protein
MWNLLIKPAFELASTVIKGKQRVKEAEISSKEKSAEAKDNWELEAIRASATSWKDELWTVLFVGIIAACFIPYTQPYVFEGFRALEETPQWFQLAIGMSVSASFAVKGWKEFKTPK